VLLLSSVYCCLFHYQLSPETFGYTLILVERGWDRNRHTLHII